MKFSLTFWRRYDGGVSIMREVSSVEELLNAKEGEQYQFKEAKTRFDFGEAALYSCALANCGGGKLVFGITDKLRRENKRCKVVFAGFVERIR